MEQILLKGKPLGRFQATVSAIPMLVSFLSAFHILAPVYVMYDPPHRCRLPVESGWYWNDSLQVQGDEHNASILLFIAELSRSDNQSVAMGTRYSSCHVRVNGSEKYCSEWVFATEEFDSTLVTELRLLCGNSQLGVLISTCSFAGILVGVLLSGFIADWLGRRITLISTLYVLTVAQVMALFSVSVTYTAAVRFLVGLGALSSYSVAYLIVSEFTTSKIRHNLAATFGYFWALGTAAAALVAFLARSWRIYAAACLVSTAVLLVLAHFPYLVPENPRWLMSSSACKTFKESDANRVAAIVRRMILDNGHERDKAESTAEEVHNLREESGRGCGDALRQLLRRRLLVLRYAIMCIIWLLVTGVYFAMSMGVKNLPGNIFATSCLIGIVDLPANLILQLAAKKIGRKVLCVVALSGCGLALVGLAAVSHSAKGHTWLIIALSLIGKMLNSTSLALIGLWTGELYPTNIRGAGVSTCSAVGRVGALLAPMLGNIKEFIPGEFALMASYLIFAASSFVSAGLALALPETRDRPLPNTIDDVPGWRCRSARDEYEPRDPNNMELLMQPVN